MEETLTDDPTEPVENAVVVDTSSPEARAQYDANVSFALGYTPRCTVPAGTPRRPRVVVTGFGRFHSNRINATGLLLEQLVSGLQYPYTDPPAAGSVDLPAPQLSVARSTLELDGLGTVDVCAMILPVYWDLAAVLVLKELDAFAPDLVVMNGIAGERQEVWIELGSVNRAAPLDDGSGLLVPRPPAGQQYAPLVPSATTADRARGLLLSWRSAREGVLRGVQAQAAVQEDGVAFREILPGVKYGGYPRGSNTYLCNNVTYVVNYAMGYPGRTLSLLQASVPRRGAVNRVPVRLQRDLRAIPRVFLHWPSALRGAHLGAAAEVLRSMLAAQLQAQRSGTERPSVGNNSMAELTPSGDTF